MYVLQNNESFLAQEYLAAPLYVFCNKLKNFTAIAETEIT
jgi:hypothetical protein